MRRYSQVLNSGAWQEDRREWEIVQTREVQRGIKRKIFPHEGSQAMDLRHREAVPSSSLEIFKHQLGKAPSNLF